ncbi:hypothetical protein BDZ91DRAFT_845040 [Kalaharituber pfeilii]|nr:hypothetical protein BDZ91DRAFT_845040 [Kalaharituber pfeilii]
MPAPVSAFSTISSYKKGSGLELRLDTSQNNMQNYNCNTNSLGGVNIPTSPVPYIKNEPLGTPPERRYSQHGFPDAYSMSGNGAYHHQSSNFGQNYESIDPSALTMSPVLNDHQGSMPRNIPIPQNAGFTQSYPPNFNAAPGMGFTTAELLSLEFSKSESMEGYSHGGDHIEDYDLHLIPATHDISLGNGTLDSGYAHTPETHGESPFTRPFQGQFRHIQSFNGASIDSPSSYASPISRNAVDINGHKSPHSKSPNTPKTPGLTGLSINGTDTSSMPIQNHHMGIHRHHKSLTGSSQWDGTPSSQISYMDSPLSSPGIGSTSHAGISELMKAKHASLPTKVENPNAPAYQSQEAKRRRRRESHNMVERRRRDHINDRIQELSHLVPQHRLEDEKVRKHLQNNSPLSPTIGALGISPPRTATSMLAAGGRRASGTPSTGGISSATGLPGDEKDKGPNKGDILNGAVSWTRDLMWCLHEKYKQEEKLREWAAANGLQFPIEPTEDEKRMKSELMVSVERNTSATRKFMYSRGPGSGLRVPGYTDLAGGAINVGSSGLTSPSVSPVHATSIVRGSGGNGGASSGAAGASLSRVQSQQAHQSQQQQQQQQGQQPQQQFWSNGDGVAFKEEEFGTMDLS